MVMEPRLNEQDLKELVLEHEQLRREILHNEIIIMQTLTATLAIVAAIMSFALSTAIQDLPKSVLFLVAESVAIIAMMQSTDKARHTYLIASYLRVFTEAKCSHLKWETRLLKLRKSHPQQGYGGLIRNQVWLYTFVASTNFALGSWYALQSPKSLPAFYMIAGLVIIWLGVTARLIRVAWTRLSKYVYNHMETFEKAWEGIRDQESSRKDAPKK
jgi:hypothetical protein